MTDLAAPGGKRIFALLWASMLCFGMGQSLVFSTLPPLARSLGLEEWQVSIMFGISAIFWVIMAQFWGRRSDVWGRKASMMIGFGGYVLSMTALPTVVYFGLTAVLPLAWMWPLMIVSRATFGFFGSANMPAAQAYVADRTKPVDRARFLAGLGASFGVGNVIGPGIGAQLQIYGMLVPFYAVSALAVVCALILFFMLPEQTKPSEQRGNLERPKLKVMDTRVFPFVILAVVAGFCHALQVQTSAFYFMDTLNLSPEETALYVRWGLMGMAGSAMASQMFLVQIFRPTPRTMIWCGLAVSVTAFALMYVAKDFYLLVFAMSLGGLGQGLTRPGASAASSLAVNRNEQGSIAGIMGGIGAGGHLFVPLVTYFLYDRSPSLVYALTAVLLLAVLVFAFSNSAIRKANEIHGHDPDETLPDGEG